MWTRSLLKQNAKAALVGRYWPAFLLCLLLGILGVSGSASQAVPHLFVSANAYRQTLTPDVWTGNGGYPTSGTPWYWDLFDAIPPGIWAILGVVALCSLVLAVC